MESKQKWGLVFRHPWQIKPCSFLHLQILEKTHFYWKISYHTKWPSEHRQRLQWWARPGQAQSPGLAIAWPFPSTTAGRPQARPGRRPLGWDKGPGLHLAISSQPCECALVFMVPAWKNHGPGLSLPTHAATSAERRERSRPHSCSPWGMASVPGESSHGPDGWRPAVWITVF